MKNIKKLFVYGPIPEILRWLCQGCEPGSFRFRLLPDCSYFSGKSTRWVIHHGIHLHLDLSDLVDWHTYFKVQEPTHDALLRLVKPGTVVYDVGANIGVTVLKASQKTGQDGLVVGFEASPFTYLRFLENCKANPHLKVYPLNKAVGAQPGFIDIQPREKHNSGMNQVKEGNTTERIRLDDFAREHQLYPTVIKLDIEGYELKALQGATEILSSYHPHLLIEIDRSNLAHFGDSPEGLRDFLIDMGYQFYHLDGAPFRPEDFSKIKHQDIIAKAK